jgi:hypothetical protein
LVKEKDSMPQTNRENPSTRANTSAGRRPGPFKVVRVERTLAEGGGVGQTWYRYILDNGRSTISGQRSGSLKDVTAYATRYAEQLNARGITGHSSWSPRAKKPA